MTLDDQLACILSAAGAEVGSFVRCIVTAEIASLIDERELIEKKILRLQNVLTGGCAEDAKQPA